jgi:acetyltransferase-like isoleucine patch superfamily enzyme
MNLIKLLSVIRQALIWFYRTIRIKTDPAGYAQDIGVRLGKNSRLLGIHGGTFGSEPYLVRLGDDVTIAAGVQFITHDGGISVLRSKHGRMDVFGPISVGNNVFIGYGAVILPGVTIGNDVVIGAGAVVTKDIPTGVVAVGVPARTVKSIVEYQDHVLARAIDLSRLSEDERKRLLVSRFVEE